jgi:hypothetical protein
MPNGRLTSKVEVFCCLTVIFRIVGKGGAVGLHNAQEGDVVNELQAYFVLEERLSAAWGPVACHGDRPVHPRLIWLREASNQRFCDFVSNKYTSCSFLSLESSQSTSVVPAHLL